jgi:GNAT superfamily N-acetyltransferase
MNHVAITVARWQDYEQVVKLRRLGHLHEASVCPEIRPDDDALAAFDASIQTAAWLRDPHTIVFVAWDGSEAIGFLAAETNSTLGFGRELTTKISGFYVQPEHRQRKVAGLLYRAALKVGRALGVKHVQALVVEGNAAMQAMMMNHHFRPVGVVYQRRIQQ